jgi:diguanylate cyclase (GGDEF)-like protein
VTVRRHPVRVLLLVTAAVVAVAVWLGAAVQRDSATTAAARTEASQRMLSSLLDQEAGLRGYQLTRIDRFLSSADVQRATFLAAGRELRSAAAADPDVSRALAATLASERVWQEEADDEIADARRYAEAEALAAGANADTTDVSTREMTRHDRLVSQVRGNIARLQTELDDYASEDQRVSMITTVVLALLSFVMVGLTGGLWLNRRVRKEKAAMRAEQEFRDGQTEFSRALLSASSEDEALALLKAYLERDGDRDVTVLQSTSSSDRLEARTPLPDDTPLASRLLDAAPRSCVAMRLSAEHAESRDDHPLLTCDLCSAAGERVDTGASCGPSRLCAPLLVSGEVIGSVLTVQGDRLQADDRRRVSESVMIAAPVLANLRTIAIAQSRAATDTLTGLPNRRAFNDTLTRMLAQSLRSSSPLTAIAIDLDHFKDINDRYGHEKGDEVLATVAAALREGTRASDFVGRWGGEEFFVLAPDTALDGALALAENLRAAIARLTVVGVDRDLSASFGVAVCPEHAAVPDLLLRQADRALYAAKALGRNRVEVVSGMPAPAEPAAAAMPA